MIIYMKKISTRKNFILYYLYQVTILLSTIITTPYISKILGSENLGIYSYTFSIANLLYIFAQLGTSTYGVREIALNKNNKTKLSKTFIGIELMTIITSIVCILVYLIIVQILGKYQFYFYIWILFIIAAALDITWFYAGIEHFEEIFIINIIVRFIGILSIFTFIKNTNHLWIYIIIHSLMYTLPFALMWISLHKYISMKNIKNINILSHLKQSFVYFIPTIAASLYMIIDKSMLGYIIEDKKESGYYEMASQIIIYSKTLTAIVISHIFEPKTTYLYKKNNISSIKKSINLSLNFTLFLCIGIVCGIFAVADDFVPIFFGYDFLPVRSLLKLMTPLIILPAISYILEYEYLMPAGKGKNINKYIILTAISNIILNIYFINKYMSSGAVIASIITEALILMCFYIKSDDIINTRDIILISYKKVIAGIIMFICIYFIRQNILCQITNQIIILISEIVIGVILYIVSLLILKDDIFNFAKDINKI